MKIVIVEDQSFMRETIRLVCQEQPACEVAGEAGQGMQAIQLALSEKPDLVILDVGLPDINGLEVATAILRQLPATRFLILSASLNDFTIYQAGKLGIHGFLDKRSDTIAQLKTALGAIAAGSRYHSPAFDEARHAMRTNGQSFEKILSSSEQEVLGLIGEGLSDCEIGLRLGISPTTAQTHRSNILKKLNIKGTPKLVVYAIRNGFTLMRERNSQFPSHPDCSHSSQGFRQRASSSSRAWLAASPKSHR